MSAAQIASSAFIGSSRQALHELGLRNLIPTIFNELFINNVINESIQWSIDLQSNWNSYNATLLRNSTPPISPNWTSEAFLSLDPHCLQHNLFQKITKSTFQKLCQDSAISDQIRLQSCKGTGAAAFLRAPASYPGFSFSNQEFKLAIKIRIRAPLNLVSPQHCICGASIDPHGDHLFKCKIGGEWQQRHSAIVHMIADIARSVNLIVQHEVPLSSLDPMRHLVRTGNERMDLIITSGDYNPTLADITITHPSLSQSTSAGNQITTPLHFAKNAERKKIAKYSASAREINHKFIPMAIETYGSMGTPITTFLKESATRYFQQISPDRETTHTARSTLIRYWRVKISTCLQRANAKLLISRTNRINRQLRHGSDPRPPVIYLEDSWNLE